MSFERTGHGFTFQCDTCVEFIDVDDERDFSEALSTIKGEGWRAYHIGGVWCHACPGCKELRR